MARRRGLVVILATEPKTAAGLGADGCHLSEVALRRQAGKRRRPWPGFLITAATHGPSALNKAALLGCDAALLSPIFPTLSHPDAQTLGPLKTRLWVRRVGFPLPVFALGGLRPATAKRLGRQALSGFAATEPFEGKGLRKSVPHR
ncbi:MAG: thiamine phosphate synthase [Rhodospirillales bacterium]